MATRGTRGSFTAAGANVTLVGAAVYAMEAVHQPDMRCFIGERIKVAEFKKNWMKELEMLNKDEDDEEDITAAMMRRMNISESELRTLAEDCGPHQLCCGDETMELDEIPKDVNLVTLRLQQQDLEKRQNAAYRHKSSRMFRKSCFLSATSCVPARPRAEDLPEEEERVAAGEVVLIVQVFKPMKTPTPLTKYRALGYLFYKVQAEVAVLGCLPLHSLRSKIACISDAAVVGDFSDDVERPHEPKASDVYKSGFFYIEDTFYNDMSDPSCRDYSKVIREWAKDGKRRVGPFKTALMEETTFGDLELRLGYPYVYVHQGYCEHVIVFSDMRMIHPSDSQYVRDYPAVLKTFPLRKRMLCMFCQQSPCTWVTYENARVTDDPFFFCSPCFRMFNYTTDGKKIGEFRAQPFLEWNALL